MTEPECCPPSRPASAAAYRRHTRNRTVPCKQSLADSAAYNATRQKARAALKPRSTATDRVYVNRRKLVAALLDAVPVCQRCQQARSTDVHELIRRSQGGSILDESNLVCLCRDCHRWVTEHPREAVEQGWARWGMRANPGGAA